MISGAWCLFYFSVDAAMIISGLHSLGLASLTSEALLSAMTWPAVHRMRSQLI